MNAKWLGVCFVPRENVATSFPLSSSIGCFSFIFMAVLEWSSFLRLNEIESLTDASASSHELYYIERSAFYYNSTFWGFVSPVL